MISTTQKTQKIEVSQLLSTCRIPLLGLLVLSSFGCKFLAKESATTSQSGTANFDELQGSRLTPAAQKLWNTYVRNATPQGELMQPGCRPHHFPVPKELPYKGVAVLIHGFTACPQQFFEWAEMLTQNGYEVLAPVMPGFGLDPAPARDSSWPEPVKDVVSYLPKVEDAVENPLDPDRSKYARLAEQMNGIASAASGEKIIAGISVGGAVAAHAVNRQPKLYTKALLMAPFFAVDEFVTRQLVDAINTSKWLDQLGPQYNTVEKLYALASKNPFAKSYLLLKEAGLADKLLGMRHSWGVGCYQERKRGRAGICDFLFSNLGAAELFGLKVMDEFKPVETFVQIVGVEDDKVASTGHIANAIKAMSGGKSAGGLTPAGGRVEACFFRTGANHSLLSRYDSPDQNKFWLKDLLRDATQFISTSPTAAYSTNVTRSLVTPFQHCHLSE